MVLPADFHFAFDVHCHWIWKFESMEKGICHNCGPGISASHFHEFWHHFRPQHTPISVRELNRSVLIVWSFTRLDSHVKFTCNKKGASWIGKYKSHTNSSFFRFKAFDFKWSTKMVLAILAFGSSQVFLVKAHLGMQSRPTLIKCAWTLPLWLAAVPQSKGQ